MILKTMKAATCAIIHPLAQNARKLAPTLTLRTSSRLPTKPRYVQNSSSLRECITWLATLPLLAREAPRARTAERTDQEPRLKYRPPAEASKPHLAPTRMRIKCWDGKPTYGPDSIHQPISPPKPKGHFPPSRQLKHRAGGPLSVNLLH